jgi:hypothetical protein
MRAAHKLWETSDVVEALGTVRGGKMTPRDLLGVFVRLAGLGMLLIGIFDFYYVVVKTLGLPTASTLPVSRSILGAITYSVLGLCIIACARLIVRFAYWQDGPENGRHR